MPAAARHLASCLLLALALLAVAGCGGDDGEDGTATEPGPSATAPREGGEKSGAEDGGDRGAKGDRGEAGSAGANEEGAERNGGPGPARGGEASIEDFGSEASGSERSSIAGAFSAYLNAVAGKDYGTACSHLSETVRRSLERLVTKRLKAKGCATILPKLLAPTAAAIAREQADGEITKVRVEGERAFVVFRAPGAKLYQLTMAREGGEWKATTVAASVLVPDL